MNFSTRACRIAKASLSRAGQRQGKRGRTLRDQETTSSSGLPCDTAELADGHVYLHGLQVSGGEGRWTTEY